MQLILLIIKDGILRRASDLHVEPDAQGMSVRTRVDGILQETFVFDLEIYTALTSRIKLLGNLDISERRKAQDGRFSLEIGVNKYISASPPHPFRESIVSGSWISKRSSSTSTNSGSKTKTSNASTK